MAYRGVEADLNRAAELRKLATKAQSSDAKSRLKDAADRLEARAAKKAARVGRKLRRKVTK